MQSQRLLAPLVLLVSAAIAACGDSTSHAVPATTSPSPAETPAGRGAERERIQVRIGDAVFQVETARTPEERAQGLSDRPSLADDAGMLFFLGEERVPGFTMRRMQFPLDFIWISKDLRVADVTENVPQPAVAGEELYGIRPDRPVLYALEVNAGIVRRYGIEVGDEVVLEPAEGTP